jgi:HupE / UreJ protein
MLSRRRRRSVFVFAVTAVVIVLQSSGMRAHDMPSDVLVQMFVRPSANHLQVLVRLPLISLLNINLPKRGEDFLDLAAIEPSLKDAARATADAVDFFEDGDKLASPRTGAVRVSLPSDTSFASYELAMAHVEGAPLPVGTEVVWNQGFFDALLEYDLPSPGTGLALHPYFTALAPRVVSSIHFLLPNGAVRTFELNNDPGLVYLNPQWHQSAWTFAKAGFLQVLQTAEYLLFLVALAIPVRRLRGLLPVAVAFAVAYSITLIASAFQIAPSGAWFPPVIASLTAIAIVCLTIDNVFIADQRHRWAVAFGFGLAYGCALSFPLRQTLQLAGSHVVASVVSYDLGVGVAQLIVLAALVPALTTLFRIAISERVGVIVVSALACHTAWHWMVSRVTFLTTINWPLSDLIELTRWGTAAAFTAAVAVFLVGFGRRLFETHRTGSATFDAAAKGRA